MGDMPHDRHGLIPMLVAIRVAAERKKRAADKTGEGQEQPTDKPKKKKKRGWFG